MNPESPHSWTVDEACAGQRLDQFVGARLEGASRTRAQRLIREGRVELGGRVETTAHAHVRAGQAVVCRVPAPEPAADLPEDIALDILFEDDALIVVNKPAGLVVHPGAGNRTGTLVNALLHHCPRLSGVGGVERPGIVHRLDKDTSGCLVAAKTDAAHLFLSAQFSARTVEKEYLALVRGMPSPLEGTIDRPVGRHPVHRERMSATPSGRAAFTRYRVEELAPGGAASLVRLFPGTGRTHQLRVHLALIGHPILGDRVYGGRDCRALAGQEVPRQLLHAQRLAFDHPDGRGRMRFEAPLPADFCRCLALARGATHRSPTGKE